ncbi:type II toxin-antitoxin system HipA family toxin [Glaciecola siphonariae]|uniref:Type II toxin-antitoxin system HipA family toxin n=1 Tax=Glaciecola siphonariae TaxID=521012 RepID=A0ABV9LT01_9ALTE
MRLEDAKQIERLQVYKGNLLAGSLSRTQKGCVFEYEQSYIAITNKGIAFHLSSDSMTYTNFGDSLPPFFAGLLPEGLRLKALVKGIKTSEDDLFSILAMVGSECIGDVNVMANGHLEKSLSEHPLDFTLDLKNADLYQLFKHSIEDENYNPLNQALSGVQEKISASMISFPLPHMQKDKFYIVKLNPIDKPALIDNEHACLALARKCGMKVNNTKIIKDKHGQRGLLVERFDRYLKKQQSDTEEHSVCMHHQEDACQFLNRYPADKYRLSYKDVLAGIAKYSTAPKIEILKALQLYAFSYLIGNGDLHAKNISIQTLATSGKTVLTPCYDIISTYIYGDYKMALKLNGRDDNIKRKDIVSIAASFSIPEAAVSLMLDKLIKACKTHHAMLFGFMSEKQKALWIKMFSKRLNDLTL